MNLKKAFNSFLDKHDIVDRYDDESLICHYEKLSTIMLNEKQIKLVNKMLVEKNIFPTLSCIIYIILVVILFIFADIKNISQILLLLFFLVTGIIFFKKNIKKYNEKCKSSTKAYLATVIEKKRVRDTHSSSYGIEVLFDFNQKDFISLNHNRFVRKIKVGDKVIVVLTKEKLVIPYNY